VVINPRSKKQKEKGKQLQSLHMMFFFGQVDLTKMSHPIKILAVVLEKSNPSIHLSILISGEPLALQDSSFLITIFFTLHH
jgi:hypothetical protein